jgi:hypothetical protein
MKFDVFNTREKKWEEEGYPRWFHMSQSGELGFTIEYDCYPADEFFIPVYYIEEEGVKYRQGDVYEWYGDKMAIGYDFESGFYVFEPKQDYRYAHELHYVEGRKLLGNKYENPELLK